MFFDLKLVLLILFFSKKHSFDCPSEIDIKSIKCINVNTSVLKVVVDQQAIFVGARNAIYKFSSNNLKEIDKTITGPVNSSIKCPPFGQCTEPRQLIPDDNKVLLLFHNENQKDLLLLACGNVLQGICYLIEADNMSEAHQVGNDNEAINYISGQGSTVAYFGPRVNGTKVLYVANSYDGRPSELTSYQLSSRDITSKGKHSKLLYF